MVSLDIPDKDVQAALGVLAIRHGHLEYILKMTVKTLCKFSIQKALAATNKQNARRLRKRIEKEARQVLGEGEALDKLLDFLQRSWAVSDRRNSFIHNLWARQKKNGPLLIQNDDHTWKLAPDALELRKLSNEIESITNELNRCRLEGRLFDVPVKTP